MMFQCHHGVPASARSGGGLPLALPFQCHHGVPASLKVLLVPSTFRYGFNATTAFLLQAGSRRSSIS